MYGSSARPQGRALTKQEQEQEDHRLAMRLQAEEERATRATATAFSQPSHAAPLLRTTTTTQQQQHGSRASARDMADYRPSHGATAVEDADYRLAMQLAGDTPQDLPRDRSGSIGSGGLAHHSATPGRRSSGGHSSGQHSARDVEPKLSKEEQEAEDLRLAMELQQLEERGAHAPPGTATRNPAAGTSQIPWRGGDQPAHAAVQHQQAAPPASVARPQPSASSTAATSGGGGGGSSARSHDLFNAISRPGPGYVGPAPSNPSQQPPSGPTQANAIDDLFTDSQSVANRPNAAPAAAPEPSRDPLDFFSAAPSGRQATNPPPPASQQQWGSTPTPAWGNAPPSQTAAAPGRDLMDDLFSAPANASSTPPPPASAPRTQPSADMTQNLELFAAGKGRAW